MRPARRCAGQHRWCCGAATCFGPRGNYKPRMGATVHTVPGIVPGKRDVPLNYHGSRVGGRQAIFLSRLACWATITGACRAPPPPAAAGSTATTLSRGDPFEGPRCRFWGAESAHYTQTILRFSGKFLTFIFSPTVTPGPAAISGPCPGPLRDGFFIQHSPHLTWPGSAPSAS